MILRKVIFIFFLFIARAEVLSQTNPVFQHLNTTNGLSYLGIDGMCMDKKGNLWVATGNGLNMFNGKSVEKFFATDYPQLQNSIIVHVTCDSSNRIWVLTAGGHVAMFDEKRQLHRVSLQKEGKFVKTAWILNSQEGNIILWTNSGHLLFNKRSLLPGTDSITFGHFTELPMVKRFDSIWTKGYQQVFYYDDHNYLYVQEDFFLKVNYTTLAIKKYDLIPHCRALAKWNENELLVYDKKSKELKIFNLQTNETSFPFRNIKDQSGHPVTADFLFAEKVNEEWYVFSTVADGIYMYNKRSGRFYNYRHNAVNPSSPGTNNTGYLAVGKEGWVFIVCKPIGISYFNYSDFIGNQPVFFDHKGKWYDGYIAGIATHDNNIFYIGTSEGLLKWQRNTNTTVFANINDEKGRSVFRNELVYSVVIDKNKKIWATTLSNGLLLLDEDLRLIRHIKNSGPPGQSIKMQEISQLAVSADGTIWACGKGGIAKIDPDTYKVDNLEHTALSVMDSLYCNPILFTDADNLWFAVQRRGLYHYTISKNKLDTIAALSGPNYSGIFCLGADDKKNIYAGTRTGLKILFTNGRVKTITQKEGLLIDRAEGLLQDKHNRIWIGNDIGLACYTPADSSLKTFDVRYGLSIYGFRVGSYFQMPDGEFFFGTPRGLQYFHPDSLFNKKISLNVSVSKIETKKFVSAVTGNALFKLGANDNQVTFHFGTVDFRPHLQTFYEYKLEGLDQSWIKATDQNSVRYNSLSPGNYVFRVRISNDNKNWQQSDNEVTIQVAAPFYQAWWFKITGVLLGLFLIWYVLKYYQRKQQKHRQDLENELVINYFASQINSRYKTDELLWDVAKNLIGKMRFEECMIYLWNEDKTVLIQKAGYGSKGSMQDMINRSNYNIPAGKGIIGAAVDSRQTLLVNDTSKDKRYFTADDKIMLSELCVPLIHGNETLGAINIEHHQKNFFTHKHLQMMTTIAVLCANQVQRIRAEEEKQKATIELLENKRRAMESRLQSLRLQMNPHFLFNALNSVQQMILANEEMVATKYLSKFSKLLRTILIQSDKETISLKEEMEILDLYIELESIRFKDSFQYEIGCDADIDTEEVKIPALLVQPFVENAIWHGLMHKEGQRLLKINFYEHENFIRCTVDDNGVGRQKAAEIRLSDGHQKGHRSKGIDVSKERLKTMKTRSGLEGSIVIIDKTNEAGEAAGTYVQIDFPIQN